MGRPRSEHPKIRLYKIRLDNEDWEKLQYLKSIGVRMTDIFRDALDTHYQENRDPHDE